jgi:hypothetical protein
MTPFLQEKELKEKLMGPKRFYRDYLVSMPGQAPFDIFNRGK